MIHLEWEDSDGDGKGDNSDSHPGLKYFQNDFQVCSEYSC